MNEAKRKQAKELVYRHHGMSTEKLRAAATNLGRLRDLTDAEIASEILVLEDEVVRHLQVSLAVSMTHDISM